jgi:hypothetical protein
MRADQIVDRGVVYSLGDETWVDHHGHAMSHYDFARESGEITALQTSDLVELGYLMIQSRLGQLLEARGLFRVHCLGIELNGRSALVLTPSGGGKSTLALALLRTTDARLLGDDMVFIDDAGNATAFHSPIGIASPALAEGLGEPLEFARRLHGNKWILPLDAIENRLADGPTPVTLLAVAVRVSSPPARLVDAERSAVVGALWRDLVVGLGLPQVIELVARHGVADLPQALPVATRRAAAAYQLAKRSNHHVLELGDPNDAAALLCERLRAS